MDIVEVAKVVGEEIIKYGDAAMAIYALRTELTETKQRLVVEETHSEKYRAELAEALAKVQEEEQEKEALYGLSVKINNIAEIATVMREEVKKYGNPAMAIYALHTQLAEAQAKIAAVERENEELRNAIDREMVIAHLGVFNRGDDPVKAIKELMLWSQGVGEYFAAKNFRSRVLEVVKPSPTLRVAKELQHVKDQVDVAREILVDIIEALPLIGEE